MNTFDPPRRLLAIGLAALAGFVDAAGFLAADSYFISFMSGNTTRLAVNIVASPARALIPALLLLGFLLGVMGGALVAEWAKKRRKSAVLTLSAGLLSCAGLLGASGWLEGSLAASVMAMGALNNTFRRNGEVSVAVTYMTGALVRFGQGLAAMAMGRRIPGWLDNLLLWGSLLAGGAIGAWLFLSGLGHTAWIGAGAAIGMAGFAFWIEQRPQPG